MSVFLAIATNAQFMPTARKFHYQFNLRDFSKVIQNMMLAQPGLYKGQEGADSLVRLWVHECHRVWDDRLLFPEDRELYMGFMKGALKEFQDVKEDDAFADPLIFTSFVAACEGHEATYVHIKSTEHLKGVLEGKLEEYNE